MTPETLQTARESAKWHDKQMLDCRPYSVYQNQHRGFRDAINALVEEVEQRSNNFGRLAIALFGEANSNATDEECIEAARSNTAKFKEHLDRETALLRSVNKEATRQLEEARRELRTRGAAKGGQR